MRAAQLGIVPFGSHLLAGAGMSRRASAELAVASTRWHAKPTPTCDMGDIILNHVRVGTAKILMLWVGQKVLIRINYLDYVSRKC